MPPRPSRFASFHSVTGLIALDTIARRYGQRPSTLVALHDPYAAYCLDEAACFAGQHAEAEAIRKATAEAGDNPSSTNGPRPAQGAELSDANGVMTLRGKVPITWRPIPPAEPTEPEDSPDGA